MAISFFSEDIMFSLKEKVKRKNWLRQIAKEEGYSIGELNYIFCSDDYLHKMNVNYLEHDTLTDIITFDNSENPMIIEGDIFISVDRVKENAKDNGVKEITEFSRVISHGVYHLCGHKDKSQEEVKIMRSKEEFAINLFESL